MVDVAPPDSGGAHPPLGLGADVIVLSDRAGGLHSGQDLVRRFMDPASGDAVPWLAPPGRVQGTLDVVAQPDLAAENSEGFGAPRRPLLGAGTRFVLALPGLEVGLLGQLDSLGRRRRPP